MIKLCFVTTVSITMKCFVLDFAKYLYAHGEFDITLICDADEEFSRSLPGYIHYIPISMKRGASFGGFMSIARLWNVFRRERFDIIQYSTPNAACYASVAAFFVRAPVRLYCQWGIAYTGFRGGKRFLLSMMEKMICRISTQVEPDSMGNLEFGLAERLYCLGKAHVVWNGSAAGVDSVRFDVKRRAQWNSEVRTKLGIPDNAILYGFVGRITRDKGINELLAAFRELLKEQEEARLLLVGPMDDADHGIALLDWAKQQPNVRFSGFSNETEKLYAAMDVFVLPSYREGFGSVVIEAQAMGVPVIVTDIPGPTSAILPDQTGLVVPVKEEKALLDTMRRLGKDPGERFRLGENGRSFALRNFDRPELFGKMLADRLFLLENAR